MTPLQHIVEPDHLLMTWQPHEDAVPRTRRVVGVVLRRDDGSYGFRYLRDSDDFRAAEAAGFRGFPAFNDTDEEINQGVLEALVRRLPPRKREDFADYLALHRLPSPFTASDFALLGYTRARLPSDGFELVPIFLPDMVPCELIVEVAGTRHVFGPDVKGLSVGDLVTFRLDRENVVDQDAVLVCHQGRPLGYINRALRGVFRQWLERWDVDGTVERLNGKAGRPLVFVRVLVTQPRKQAAKNTEE